jgi:hypothetical protein
MKTRTIALIAILASLYAAGTYLPGFPIIGVEGSSIKLVRSLEMVYGLLLGPVYGSFASFLGALTGSLLIGSSVGLILTPLAAISSFVSGCLGRKMVYGIPAWIISAIFSGVVIAGWLISPATNYVPLYVVPHLAALLLILLLRGKFADLLESKDRRKMALGVVLCSIPGTMNGHLLGGIIFCNFLGLSPLVNVAVLPTALIERTVIVIVSTFVGAPLLSIVRQLYPELKEL